MIGSTMSERLAVPLPRSMRTLERDRRGYPIPFIVMRDRTGRPHFTVNDARRVDQCISKRLCGLCGKRRDDGDWLVGGLRCFGPMGAFLDPPTHRECAEYALRVCPYLAAPSYGRRIDDRTITAGAMPADMVIVADTVMAPERPEVFGLGQAAGLTVERRPGSLLFIPGGWLTVQHWRHGQEVEIGAAP